MNKKNTLERNLKLIAENRKARYNYFIEEELECGIVLEGSEVKSMRANKTSVVESYASIEEHQLWLINCYIPNYKNAKTFTHDERRRRKLLVKKRELLKLIKNKGRLGMTLIPLKLYFNKAGIAKLLLGVGKGKKLVDKRQTEKKRDWEKQQGRLLREKN
ncbi:MAG: SsrA-binding protein [Rhodobacteraceae bacterium]|nr:MAG: SsrA-binding protein [Paracoccaceae bacterium]